MMVGQILQPKGIVSALKATSKKQVLLELAKAAARVTGVHERAIFDVLLERERLGSTGMGKGVAIPHGKLSTLDGVHAVFARLERPVDFDAVDDAPVDLVFMLLAPEHAGADHLKALAKVSRLLRDDGLCEKLRGCESRDAILALISERDQSFAA